MRLKTRTKVAFLLAAIASLAFMISQVFMYLDIIHFSYNIPLFNILLFAIYMPSSAIFGWDMYMKYRDENDGATAAWDTCIHNNQIWMMDSGRPPVWPGFKPPPSLPQKAFRINMKHPKTNNDIIDIIIDGLTYCMSGCCRYG